MSVDEFLRRVEMAPALMQDMMRREGFVINNLKDRWQKLVFTLYTELVELSEGAHDILTQEDSMTSRERGI